MRDQAPEHTDLTPEQIAAARAAPAAPAGSLALREVLGTVPFWQIFLGLFACGFSMNLLGTHGMPMLMDHGFDAHASALGIGLIGFVAIFGTLVLGRLADRLPRRRILAVIYAVRGLGFFALVLVGTHWELYLAATIGGLVWAGSIALSSAILADVYGVRLVGVAVRPGLRRPPAGRHAQFLAGRLGLRGLRHALDRLRRRRRPAAGGGRHVAAAAAAGIHADGAGGGRSALLTASRDQGLPHSIPLPRPLRKVPQAIRLPRRVGLLAAEPVAEGVRQHRRV